MASLQMSYGAERTMASTVAVAVTSTPAAEPRPKRGAAVFLSRSLPLVATTICLFLLLLVGFLFDRLLCVAVVVRLFCTCHLLSGVGRS